MSKKLAKQEKLVTEIAELGSQIITKIDKRKQQIADYEKVLKDIRDSPHKRYPADPTEYYIGVADGHRCAAKMARDVLNKYSQEEQS